jgi:hypothetical protein
MVNKMILAIMAALLAINLFAWNKITVNNEKEISRISNILDQCIPKK